VVSKRRRGTAIIDTPEGILVVSRDNRTFYLPGGGAESGESRKDCCFLFEYTSFVNSHKVFLIETEGVARAGNEIKYLSYFDGSNLKVSNTTWEILELYHLEQK
jgi:8-oxo-dGTP diphosphatase